MAKAMDRQPEQMIPPLVSSFHMFPKSQSNLQTADYFTTKLDGSIHGGDG